MSVRIPILSLSLLVTVAVAYPISAQETCYDVCQDWVCDPQTWVEDTCGGGCGTVCDTCEDCWQECDMDTCWPVCNPYPCNCREECEPTYPCNGRWEPDPPNCYWGGPYECNPHPCPPVCGDLYCAPGLEDCGTCLTDCPCWDPATPVCQANQCVPPVCGDLECSAGEDCSSCADDCGTCPPPSPVCGDLACNGAEDCSSCAEDCGTCPPPPGDVFAYTDETYDGNNFSVHAVAETDYSGGNAVVELETTITLESTGETIGSSSSAGYPSTETNAGGAVPDPPPPAEVSAAVEPGTVVVIGVVVRLVIGGVIQKIKSWFSKTRYGASILCYQFAQDLGESCGYALIPGCNVNCAAQMPLYVEVKTSTFPVCTPRVEASVLWSRKGSDAPKCGFFTVHSHPPSCACGQS